MKWKILGKFLLLLILAAILIFNINLYVSYKFLFNQTNYSQEHWRGLTAFSLDFQQYLEVVEGKPRVTSQGIKELTLRQGWIQILDAEGYEVYQWNKPQEALTHYTPSQMVYYNIYTGALGDYTTFVGTYQTDGYKWSYIIGFPMEKVAKYIFTYHPEQFKMNLVEAMVCIFIVPIVVFIVIGYLFGRQLANPVIHIIEAIHRLAQGEYEQKYQEKGLYWQS